MRAHEVELGGSCDMKKKSVKGKDQCKMPR